MMMNSIGHLDGAKVHTIDGELGHVKEAYFDDQAWAIRYLVVDTGTWLEGREVLISPYAVKQARADAKHIDVSLTRDQVRRSPAVDTHQPVSRQHETDMLRYYAYPEYWTGGDLWAMGPLPMLPAALPTSVESAEQAALREANVLAEDVHLRSSADVTGYDIQAVDGSIGHVADFVFDADSWAIRQLVVDTRNWWPGGKKVLVEVCHIERIDWADRTVFTGLTRKQIKSSPEYVPEALVETAEAFRISG